MLTLLFAQPIINVLLLIIPFMNSVCISIIASMFRIEHMKNVYLLLPECGKKHTCCSRFSRYPITIFSPLVRFILTFVLPFAWVAFYPATYFIGSEEFRGIAGLTPLVGIAVFALGYFIWSRGVRNYASTGS